MVVTKVIVVIAMVDVVAMVKVEVIETEISTLFGLIHALAVSSSQPLLSLQNLNDKLPRW